MGSLTFPALYPAVEELTLVDDTTSIFQSAFGAGLTQRVSRIGPRWWLKLEFESLSQQQRHNLMAFLSAVKGHATAFMYWPRHSTFRGSFPASELLPNVEFDDTSGWSVSSELGLYADGNRLRSTRTGVTGDRYLYASQLTGLTSGAAYLFRAGVVKGAGPPAWNIRCGATAGATTYFNTVMYTEDGIAHSGGTIGATTAYASLGDYNDGGRVVADYQIFDGLSFARCARVNGASQTGSGINVKNLPVSTNGLLLPGDLVSIYTTQWELKRVTNSLNSDSSGLGYLQFESKLRASPSDDASVAIYRPSAKFIMLTDPIIKTKPGMYSDIELELIEVIEP